MPPRRGRQPTQISAQNNDRANDNRPIGRPRGRLRGRPPRPRGRPRGSSQSQLHSILASQGESFNQTDTNLEASDPDVNSLRDEISLNELVNLQQQIQFQSDRRSRGRPRGSRTNHPIRNSTSQTTVPQEVSQSDVRDEISSNDDITISQEVPHQSSHRPRSRPRGNWANYSTNRLNTHQDTTRSQADQVILNDDVLSQGLDPQNQRSRGRSRGTRASRRTISQVHANREANDNLSRDAEVSGSESRGDVSGNLREEIINVSNPLDNSTEVVATTIADNSHGQTSSVPSLGNEEDEVDDGGDPEAHIMEENEQDRWKKFEVGAKSNKNLCIIPDGAVNLTRQQRITAFLKGAPEIKPSRKYEELDSSLKTVVEFLDNNEIIKAFCCLQQISRSHTYITFQRLDKYKIFNKLNEKYDKNQDIIDEFLIEDGKPSPLFSLLINGLRTKLDDILTTPHLVDSNCAKIRLRDVLNKKIKLKFVGKTETYLKKAWPYRRFKNISEGLTRRTMTNNEIGSFDSTHFDSSSTESHTSGDDHDDFSEGEVANNNDADALVQDNLHNEDPLGSINQEVINNDENPLGARRRDIVPYDWEEESNNDESGMEPHIASDDDFSDSSVSDHYTFWFMKDGVKKKIALDSTVYTVIHSYLTKKEIRTLKVDEIFEKEYIIHFEKVEEQTYENDNDLLDELEFHDQMLLILNLMRNLYNTYNRSVFDYYDPDIFRSSQIIQKLRPFEKKLISRITGYYPKVIVTLLSHYGFLFDGFCRHKYFIRNLFGLRKVPRGLSLSLIDLIRSKKLLPKTKKKENVQKEGLTNWTREKFHKYSDAKTTFGITFAGEMGIGAGVTRDFFTQMSHYFQTVGSNMWIDLETSPNLDDYVSNEYNLYPTLFDEAYAASDEGIRVLKDFYILGMLTAKSLADKQIMEIPLNKLFLKKLIFGEFPTPELFNYDFTKTEIQSRKKEMKVKKLLGLIDQINPSITKMINHFHSVQNNLEFSDCYYIPAGRSWHKNNLVSIDLPELESQNSFYVFLNKIKEVIFETGIREQISKFREGFNHVFPLDHLKNFYTVEEIHKVVFHNKKEDWSADVIRRAFFVNNESFKNEVDKISQILSKFNIDEQRKMLRFFTGSTRLPIGGWTKLKPELAVIEDTGAYPIGRTCFNKLSVPRNNSLQGLEDKLKLVINNSEIAERIDRE
ncbi:16309_t:CDS:2 [Funneliformis caledonium]|uniref:16309_t:CDS:1 n=1 Tax=Funneliformis caledonium TaxID=1117310 RepID=A0A9N8ZRL2_9GLOM|nr:16309_t:CDS:2 [Funneliformis caledonium]